VSGKGEAHSFTRSWTTSRTTASAPSSWSASTESATDFDRALRFYRDTLGFEVAYTYGEPPFWGEPGCDDVAFNLRHTDESPWRPGVPDGNLILFGSPA
jgi:hypothetical protein